MAESRWRNAASFPLDFPSLVRADGTTLHLDAGEEFDWDFGEDGSPSPWIEPVDTAPATPAIEESPVVPDASPLSSF